jgi:hypothetical protein
VVQEIEIHPLILMVAVEVVQVKLEETLELIINKGVVMEKVVMELLLQLQVHQ